MMNDDKSLPDIHLFDPGFYENPYPIYHALRTLDPVLWDPQLNAWVLTGYDDVRAAMGSSDFSRGASFEEEVKFKRQLVENGEEEFWPLHSLLFKMMLFSDPPKHTRLRALVNKAFTPRIVRTMTDHIQTIVDDLLYDVQSDGRMDVINDLAYPLPVIVIMEMLGLPTDERDQFKQWSYDVIAYAAGVDVSQQVRRRALHSVLDMTDYFVELADRLRKAPDESLMSGLVAAEEQGETLSEEEMLANAVLLLMNGHETTTYMIGNGLLALLNHPKQSQKLQENPSLIEQAVEELMRYDGSVQLRGLTAAGDLTVRDKAISKGEQVFAVIGAANRDPGQFSDPDKLDITRQDVKHITFGHGAHYCIGAALARAELQITLATLLQRMPGIQLAAKRLEWHSIPVFRGLKSLPVTF